MNESAKPLSVESAMQARADSLHVEGLLLMNYLNLKHPSVLNDGCNNYNVTVDMFIEAMHEGYTYIAQHNDYALMKRATAGAQCVLDGAFDYLYWLFGAWLHEEPIGYSESACKLFSITVVRQYGPALSLQSMAKNLACSYSVRDGLFDMFYKERLTEVLMELPKFMPDKDSLVILETYLKRHIDKEDFGGLMG